MKAEVRFTDDRKQIISVWQSVFGDDEKYIADFLEKCGKKRCLGVFVGEELGAMLFLIDCTFEGMSGAYVYAVATLEKYRKQGFMRKLLDYSKRLDYDFLCLVPAEEYLFSVYSKFGFEPKLYSFKTGKLNKSEKSAHFETYFKLRNEYISVPYIKLKDEKYQYFENISCGGEFLIGDGYIAAVRDGEICEYITEGESSLSAEPVGMIYYSKNNNGPEGYIGLYMD